MATVEFLCKVCEKNLSTEDEVVSTQCGHVFHGTCLERKKKERSVFNFRKPKCPQCHAEIKTTFNLYLYFGTGPEIGSEVKETFHEKNILQQELEVTRKAFQNAHSRCVEKNEQLNEFKKKVEQLKLQIKEYIKNIDAKNVKIHSLEKALEQANPKKLENTAYEEEIKVLQEKNKLMSLEIAKEIRNSSQLTVEKMKLESMLEHMKSNKKRVQETEDKVGDFKNLNDVTEDNTKSNSNFKVSEDLFNDDKYDEKDCIQSVVIKNVNENFENEEVLKKYVYKLSDMMNLFLTGDDILEVRIFNRQNENKISLKVKFKTLSIKSMFLSRKDKLKQYEEAKHLSIYEYVTDDIRRLFLYAKCLRFVGYNHIYCRNNKVLAKKNRESVAIEIKSKNDIDKLEKEANKIEEHEEN